MNTNLALKFEPEFTKAAEDFGKGNVIQSIKDDYTQIGFIKEKHNKLIYHLGCSLTLPPCPRGIQFSLIE